MVVKNPLCLYDGKMKELQPGDQLPGCSSANFSSMQFFTASGVFTVPAGVKKLIVEVIGGGGGGGAYDNSYRSCGGGGYAKKIIVNLTPGTRIPVTVGASGGTSSFGSYCSATGGQRGIILRGGVPGYGIGGDINLRGSYGGMGNITKIASITMPGGNGAPGYMGLGAGAGAYYGHRDATSGADNTGGGGGGSCTSGRSATKGGSGLVIIHY